MTYRENFQSFVPATKKLPELTIKAVLVGALLSIVLGSANAYFGMYAGMTVSAAIPGAEQGVPILGRMVGILPREGGVRLSRRLRTRRRPCPRVARPPMTVHRHGKQRYSSESSRSRDLSALLFPGFANQLQTTFDGGQGSANSHGDFMVAVTFELEQGDLMQFVIGQLPQQVP